MRFLNGVLSILLVGLLSSQIVLAQSAEDTLLAKKIDRQPLFRSIPFLQNPVNNGITISWFTNEPSLGWVEFGTDQNLGNKAEAIKAGQVVANVKNHEVRLANLEPGKKYYYRIASKEVILFKAYKKKYGETVYSEIYDFTLPDPKTSDFTAIIFNDLHKNKKVLKGLMRHVKDIDYDFTMFNGDCLADAVTQDAVINFLTYSNEQVNAANKPIFHIRGNHETRGPYSFFVNDLTDNADYKTYGSFSWGDTRFLILDCGDGKPDDNKKIKDLARFDELRKEEFDFVKNEMKERTFKKAAKRVLVHHIPLYHNEYEDKVKRVELWGDLFNKCNFDVAINGHTHHFAFNDKNTMGNAYPVVIGGGKKENDATIMILEKDGNRLILKVIGFDGTVLGEYNL